MHVMKLKEKLIAAIEQISFSKQLTQLIIWLYLGISVYKKTSQRLSADFHRNLNQINFPYYKGKCFQTYHELHFNAAILHVKMYRYIALLSRGISSWIVMVIKCHWWKVT